MPDYGLLGPQVEPEASYWMRCPRPCVVHLNDLRAKTDDEGGEDYFPPYPTDAGVVAGEVNELRELAHLRDEPFAFPNTTAGRERRSLSLFLQLRPHPINAVINTTRDPNAPVIATPRELSRYFEMETPGLAHRHALDYLLRSANYSPPRQSWIWAGLEVAVHSALLAAWHYKWLATKADGSFRVGVARRPRPIELAGDLNILYDRATNSTNSGDAGPRPAPQPSAGTPRHPAYPSGHSTYAGAASELLSYFFPAYKEQFDDLADNVGLARLWAGIHYRSDHIEGMKLGRTVARLVIQQIQESNVPVAPTPYPAPPTVAALEALASAFEADCGVVQDSDNVPSKRPATGRQAPGPQQGAR